MSEGTRILALVTGAFGENGGIASYNRAVLRALAADPRVDTVFALARRGHEARGVPAKVRQLTPIGNPAVFALAAMVMALARRPKVIFCGHLHLGWLAVLAARIAGAKLVIQAHGVEVWRPPRLRRRRRAPARADLILCVSRDTREKLLAWCDIAPERVIVVPNTVSARFTPGDPGPARARLGLAGHQRLILSVGRLDHRERYKGQDLAIGLIGELRAGGHEVTLLIAGDGDDRPRLEALAEAQGLAAHVRFLGQVCDDALLDLYRAADLYFMPSKGEGFGIVFLEAMACGTPAIGLAHGGAADALRPQGGRALAEADLLEAVDRALRGPAPDRLALSAEIHRRYGEAVFTARIGQVLDRLEIA